jgi:hypothetical protein
VSKAFALFAAFLAATIAHIVYVVAHEPFSFDAWNVAVDTHSEPANIGRFFAYWQSQYTHGNPRLGQPLTYLAYKITGFAEVMTPLAFVGLTLAIVILGLGRWPRRGRDLALWAIAIGVCWFALPHLGRNMFCRAYAANYIYGAAIQLGVLAALRLRMGDAATKDQIATYMMLGIAAGMCNEHTGPALIACLVAVAAWRHRRSQTFGLVAATAVGATLGFLVIFFAPGQGERYGGLAHRMGLVERIVDRGVAGGFDILRDYLLFAAPLLVLLALVTLQIRNEKREDSTRNFVVLALVAGLIVTATLCASPKLGSRFFIAPLALLLASFIALADRLTSPRWLAGLVVLAVSASTYAAVRTLPLFRQVGTQGDQRMADLAATQPGDTFNAKPFAQVGESWWFIGDDFRDKHKRAMVTDYLGLSRVTFPDHRRSGRTSAAPQPD